MTTMNRYPPPALTQTRRWTATLQFIGRNRSGLVAAWAIASLLIFSGTAVGAQSQPSNGDSATRTDIDISGPFLQHLTKDPHSPGSAFRCGEPQITQDALHPGTLVVDCMSGQINYQTPMANMFWAFKDVTKGNNWHQPCYVFISRDGGNSWHEVRPDPLMSAVVDACADPIAEQGPKGELYLAEDVNHFPVNGEYGLVTVQPDTIPLELVGIAFTRSLDGGKTWSKVALVPTAVDRPFWTVDESTGTIYDLSGCARITTIGEYGCTPTSRNLATSTNNGRTWAPAVNIRSLGRPTSALTAGRLHDIGFGGFESSVSAALGVVALAGQTGSHGGAATVEFAYSTNKGATFTSRTIPLGNTMPCVSPFAAGVAADPVRRDTFAVIVLCNPNPGAVRVFVTHNTGATWTETADLAAAPPPGYVTLPANAGSSPSHAKLSALVSIVPTPFDINRPWVAYGPTGALGVLWRQNYGPPPPSVGGPIPPGPQDVFVAIAADGEKGFSTPVRINTAASPPADPRQFVGDDISDLILDSLYAYAVWGDWRSGELETWFRKVPIPLQHR